MTISDVCILVVDDEVALRQIFARWLRASGAEVLEAGNGAEAFDLIQRSRVDVLITDVRMPVMDGVTLVRRIAESGRQIACIIFVSAFSDVDTREMYGLGVEAFLAKPFRLEELTSAVHQALATRPACWTEPLPTAPRQNATFHAVDPNPDNPLFQLGRGGFSAASDQALTLGAVSFQCDLPTGGAAEGSDRQFSGQGYVRWRSRVDHRIGIEFVYLDPPGRDWIADQISAKNPRSFIP